MLGLSKVISQVTDSRKRPRRTTEQVISGVLIMLLTRLGSLNALEKTKEASFWKNKCRTILPSADSIARIMTCVDPATLRAGLHQLYTRLKRNKAIVSRWQGLIPVILDGHESHATYHRHCAFCLERMVHKAQGDRTQYYHRHITALLVVDDFYFLLDAEQQQPGEDEVACAIRLLERLFKTYPRAFDLVLGDALYTDPRFYHCVTAHGKKVLTVLKDDRRDLIQDARGLFALQEPQNFSLGKKQVTCWDVSGLTSWSQFQNGSVRVVMSEEIQSVRRQLTKQEEEIQSTWMWVTTLFPSQAKTQTVVQLGHLRWAIENQGFNETVQHWHADHVYRHESCAMQNFCLVMMIAYNLFHAFFRRNLKPIIRKGRSYIEVAKMMLAELYAGIRLQAMNSS